MVFGMKNQHIFEELIGKSLKEFQQCSDMQILSTAIIIVILETRFASLISMWYGIVEKACKCLTEILDKDNKKLESLLESIKNQLE